MRLHITVTYQGGQDAGSFVYGTVIVTPANSCGQAYHCTIVTAYCITTGRQTVF